MWRLPRGAARRGKAPFFGTAPAAAVRAASTKPARARSRYAASASGPPRGAGSAHPSSSSSSSARDLRVADATARRPRLHRARHRDSGGGAPAGDGARSDELVQQLEAARAAAAAAAAAAGGMPVPKPRRRPKRWTRSARGARAAYLSRAAADAQRIPCVRACAPARPLCTLSWRRHRSSAASARRLRTARARGRVSTPARFTAACTCSSWAPLCPRRLLTRG